MRYASNDRLGRPCVSIWLSRSGKFHLWTVNDPESSSQPHYWITYRSWHGDTAGSQYGFEGEALPAVRVVPVRHPEVDKRLAKGQDLPLPQPNEEEATFGYRRETGGQVVVVEFGEKEAGDSPEFTAWLDELRAYLDEAAFGTARRL